MSNLNQADPAVARVLKAEKERQRQTVNLVASENYASPAVLEAQGSFITCKYAEGYPHRRYYGGCENVDIIEDLTIERAKTIFHAGYANVQAHSGAQANMAAYYALLKYDDAVLAMDLAHGGHLTHGAPVSFSGRLYDFSLYGLDRETERIDFEQIEKLARERRPRLIVAGASAYPRVLDFERFRRIADEVGAYLMVDMAHIAGLVAAGLHPSPVPYADVICSTTHKTLRGPRSGFILCREELGPGIDTAVFPEMQGGPFMHIIMAKAVCFHEAIQPEFAAYQMAVLENARVLAEGLAGRGLRLVSGGTDTHLILVDLTKTGVTGSEAQEALEAAAIVVNRNAVPFDTRPARITSGIRLGTPAVTTRGFGPGEMQKLAGWIADIVAEPGNAGLIARVCAEVGGMCRDFPIPGIDELSPPKA